MKTIIELFDKDIIYNVYAAAALKPENVVFIFNPGDNKKDVREIITGILKRHTPKTKVYFKNSNTGSVNEIVSTLKRISTEFPECAVELTGGGEEALFAAGIFYAEKKGEIFSFNPATGKYKVISGDIKIPPEKKLPDFSIDDFALMAGGSCSGHGHFNSDLSFGELEKISEKIWNVFLYYQDEWHSFVSFLQKVTREPDGISSKLSYTVPDDGCNAEIMTAINNTGAFDKLSFGKTTVSFKYKSFEIKRLLNDFGVWLELHLYSVAKKSGEFNNVEMSVILDWNGIEGEADNVTNEIDVMITRGAKVLFISCKAGNVSAAAMNEIVTLTGRFGGGVAKAVLAVCANISKTSPKLYKRARELGIYVIELDDLKRGNLLEIFRELL